MAQTIVWDLDGTILDSAERVLSHLRSALVESGFPAELANSSSFASGDIESLLSRSLDTSDVSAVIQRYRSAASRDGAWLGVNLYPGVLDALDWARETGHLNYLISQRLEPIGRQVISEAKIENYFDAIYFRRSSAETKTDLVHDARAKMEQRNSPARLMVGDSSSDRAVANLLSVRMVWVDWGYEDPIPGPNITVIQTAAELLRAIQQTRSD